MKIINVKQGSSDWHKHRAACFNASEAAAMMGASKYATRAELLRIKAGGEAAEVSSFQQALFDRGHETEALARPIVERLIADELFPVVGVSDTHPNLAASFDGITMDGETGYEHKLWNEAVAASIRDGSIADDPAYYWQMEQQILVGGLKRVIFVCSDGTEDNFEHFIYTAVPGRAEQLLAGWVQFQEDLGNYTHREVKPAPVAAPVTTLPAVVYTIDRSTMALTSNIKDFRAAAEVLVERSKTPLETDQDFADREALCKAFGEAEKLLKMKAEEVIGQIQDVAAFSLELGDIAEMFRTARLAGEKLVDAEKKNRRAAIQTGAEQAFTAHINALNARLGRVQMPKVPADFAAPMKGKKNLDSMQDAVDSELARAKIEANAIADAIDANLSTLDELAADHGFLFRDLQQLVTMPAEAFRATIEGRVATHKAQEQAKLDAERERIAREEREKAEREARAKVQAEQAAKTPEAAPAAPVAAPAAAQPAKAAAKQATQVKRPRDESIVEALAMQFDVTTDVAAGWLITMDMAAVAKMAEAVEA